MFLEDKLIQTGKMLIGVKDPTEARLLLNSMIREAFTNLLDHLPDKPTMDELIGQFRRVNITWTLVVKQLNQIENVGFKPGGFRDFVEAQREFKGLKGKL